MWYFTDIHGNGDLAIRAMEIINGEEFIFGGDAIDRGIEGYEIAKDFLRMPNCHYLKGNHEDLFVQSAHAINTMVMNGDYDVSKHIADQLDALWRYDDSIRLHLYNGGAETIASWINDGMPYDPIEQLDNLPVMYQYKEYDFCHAGCMPQLFDNPTNKDYDIHEMIWSRNHFSYGWRPNRILVHGHTPCMFMKSRWRCDRAPVLYAGGSKMNLDGGTFEYPHQLFLLNLDTREVIRLRDVGLNKVIEEPCSFMDRSDKLYYDAYTLDPVNVQHFDSVTNQQ